jgi:hypothetical protein
MTVDYPVWEGQMMGARWIDSIEYLEAWDVLPSRWALPVPQVGTDPAAEFYHAQVVLLSQMIPSNARRHYNKAFLTLLDRRLGVMAYDRAMEEGGNWTQILVTDDSQPRRWEWLDPQISPGQAATMVFEAVRVASVWSGSSGFKLQDVVGADWEKPKIASALAPLGRWEMSWNQAGIKLAWRIARMDPSVDKSLYLNQALAAVNPEVFNELTPTGWQTLVTPPPDKV